VLGNRGKTQKFVSGPKMSAADMVKEVPQAHREPRIRRRVIGYPGLVIRGKIAADPYNPLSGTAGLGFDFEAAFGKPVRVINDAAMQAWGVTPAAACCSWAWARPGRDPHPRRGRRAYGTRTYAVQEWPLL